MKAFQTRLAAVVLRLTCLLLCLLPARAEQFSFKTFAEEEGLTSLAIRAHVQDQDGFHWLSTDEGLFRFDVERFTRVTNFAGLQETEFGWLKSAPDGSMWLRGATTIWQLRQGKASARVTGLIPEFETGRFAFQDFDVDQDGNLWFVHGQSLYRLPAASPALHFPSPSSPASSPQPFAQISEPLFSLQLPGPAEAQLGTLLGCGQQLCDSFQGGFRRWGPAQGVPPGEYTLLFRSRGRVFARSRQKILEFDAPSQRWQDLTQNLPALGLHSNTPSVAITAQGQLLTNCEGGFAEQLPSGRWRLLRYQDDASLPEAVQTLLVARRGGIWVGAPMRGLMNWTGNGLWRSFQRDGERSLRGLTSVVSDLQGLPYALSVHGRIVHGRLDPAGEWRFALLDPKLPTARQILFAPPASSAENPAGALWLIPRRTKELVRYDLALRRLDAFPLPEVAGRPNTLLLFDNDSLAVATSTGLFRLRRSGSAWNSLRLYPPPGSAGVEIKHLSGNRNALWAAGAGKLIRISPNQIQEFEDLPGLGSGLQISKVASAPHRTSPADELVLVADTKESRFAALLFRGGKLTNVTPPVLDRKTAAINSLLVDSRNQFWVATDIGLVMWDGLAEWRFAVKSGLPGNRVGQVAMHQGQVRWAATSGGLGLFTPFLFPPEQPAPKIIVSEARLGPVRINGDLAESPADRSDLFVRFAVLAYIPAVQTRVRYRLPSQSPDWHETVDRSLMLHGIDPGLHTLEMQAMGLDGIWGPTNSLLRFRILPLWYQTWWAKGLAALLALSGLGLFIRNRTQSAQQKAALLLQQMVDANPSPIFILDADGRFQLANRSLKQFVNLTQEEMLGKLPQDLAFPLFGREFAQHFAHCRQQPGVCVWEQSTALADLSPSPDASATSDLGPREIRITLFPITGERGHLQFLAGFLDDITDRNQLSRDLQALSDHRAKLLEQERARIASEIHDALGQQLTAMKIGLKLLRGADPQRVQELVAQADETIQALRRIASELRPAILDHYGLAAAIEWQCREFAKKTELAIACHVPSSLPPVASETAITAFRILQESLSNAAQHAQAKHLDVLLTCQAGRLTLTIEDDGIGLKPPAKDHQRFGFGLLGMRERARSVGGTCTTRSKRDGCGTIVEAILPLAGSRAQSTLPATPNNPEPAPSLSAEGSDPFRQEPEARRGASA